MLWHEARNPLGCSGTTLSSKTSSVDSIDGHAGHYQWLWRIVFGLGSMLKEWGWMGLWLRDDRYDKKRESRIWTKRRPHDDLKIQ